MDVLFGVRRYVKWPTAIISRHRHRGSHTRVAVAATPRHLRRKCKVRSHLRWWRLCNERKVPYLRSSRRARSSLYCFEKDGRIEAELIILWFRPIAFAQAGVTTFHHQRFKIAGSVYCWSRDMTPRLEIRGRDVIGTTGNSLRRCSTCDFVVHRIKNTGLVRIAGDAGGGILSIAGSRTCTEAERPQVRTEVHAAELIRVAKLCINKRKCRYFSYRYVVECAISPPTPARLSVEFERMIEPKGLLHCQRITVVAVSLIFVA